MKKLLLLVIVFISCSCGNPHNLYHIEQEITDNPLTPSVPQIATYIWQADVYDFPGKIIWSRHDLFNGETCDSIKRMRYEQAQNQIKKYKEFEKLNCK